jgi:hypothetical protein
MQHVVHKVAMKQVFPQIQHFNLPVSITPPMLHTHHLSPTPNLSKKQRHHQQNEMLLQQ